MYIQVRICPHKNRLKKCLAHNPQLASFYVGNIFVIILPCTVYAVFKLALSALY